MKKLLLTLTVISSLSACLSNQPIQPTQSPPTSSSTTSGGGTSSGSPPSGAAITLNDGAFDVKLSTGMNQGQEPIAVSLGKDIEPEKGEMPSQMQAWLGAIEATGGEVKREPFTEEEMFLGAVAAAILAPLAQYLVEQMIAKYQQSQAQSQYQPAQNYHARVCYDKKSYLVSKVVFVRRDSSTGQQKKAVCGVKQLR